MSVTSKQLAGLYRTFYPKYPHYMSDGEGRDTYILKHNGGMWKEAPRPLAESTFYSKRKPSVSPPAPHKEATSFKYISDGNGRDFYITHNSGGLQAAYVPGAKKSDAAFISSLRTIEKRNEPLRFPSPKEIERRKHSLRSQKLLIQRLTSNSKQWKKMNKEYRTSVIKERVKSLKLPDTINDYGSSHNASYINFNNTGAYNGKYLFAWTQNFRNSRSKSSTTKYAWAYTNSKSVWFS